VSFDPQPASDPSRPAALTGIRVVDLSRVLAGPLCTQMLADHGADVVKVEPPGGDETRAWGPPFVDATTSSYYMGLNRGKRNVCLDLHTAEAQVVLADLLASADVLVENFRVGTLARWGFDDDTLRQRFPRLVVCRITGYGTDGPVGGRPGYDAAAQAYGGLMSVNGEADGPPLRVGVPIVDMVTGNYAFAGILLALRERDRTGHGQLVDCTLLDTAISLLHPHLPAYLTDGTVPPRTGSAHPSIAPYDTFDAAGGPVFVGAANDRQFRSLVTVLGCAELADDPRFATNGDRVRNVAHLRPLLAEQLTGRPRRELVDALLAVGVPASEIHDVGQALADPQVRHRQMVVERPDYRGVGVAIKLDRTPGRPGFAPRARGADTAEVLAALGYSPDRIAELIDAGAAIVAG
jgi:crotonobetainyl-CoA:carnitine CoA-transferase CaiB-like acyl-CoA transferase